MRGSRSAYRLQRRVLAGALLTACSIGVLASGPAQAHFILQAPDSLMSQDPLGFPEKLGPCGDEGGGTPSGVITAFQPGQTITVTVNEVIFHPGHYRIALAPNDPSELPPEPPVTAGAQACGTTTVESPPVYPVLADDVFDHTAPFTSPQSMQLTLPTNVTCSNCTLQIIEFMSDHGLNNPGGCFYHHCANISIGVSDGGATEGGIVVSPDAAAPTDASVPDDASAAPDGSATVDGSVAVDASEPADASHTGGSDAGPKVAAAPSSGCACSVPVGRSSALAGLGGLVALTVLVRRRNRRPLR